MSMLGEYSMSVLVLVVDDDPKRMERVRRLVAGEGADTVTASDSREAMRHFVRREPDLALLHVDRSDEISLTLCRDMKGVGVGRRRSIVVVAPRASRSAAFEAGCDVFVEQRPDDGSLLRAVRSFLASHRRPKRIAAITLSP
jgi:CheY-like chemotaxis protein